MINENLTACDIPNLSVEWFVRKWICDSPECEIQTSNLSLNLNCFSNPPPQTLIFLPFCVKLVSKPKSISIIYFFHTFYLFIYLRSAKNYKKINKESRRKTREKNSSEKRERAKKKREPREKEIKKEKRRRRIALLRFNIKTHLHLPTPNSLVDLHPKK